MKFQNASLPSRHTRQTSIRATEAGPSNVLRYARCCGSNSAAEVKSPPRLDAVEPAPSGSALRLGGRFPILLPITGLGNFMVDAPCPRWFAR
jgi:hypothetical protein